MRMPVPDTGIIARRAEIARRLGEIVGPAHVVADAERLRAYESDGLTAYRTPPMVVVLPAATAEVAAVLAYCKAEGVKVVPRGAGTSLSGGRCRLPMASCSAWRGSTACSRSTMRIAAPSFSRE